MIHQHFKLVDVFTATENVKLGLKDSISAVRKALLKSAKILICSRSGQKGL